MSLDNYEIVPVDNSNYLPSDEQLFNDVFFKMVNTQLKSESGEWTEGIESTKDQQSLAQEERKPALFSINAPASYSEGRGYFDSDDKIKPADNQDTPESNATENVISKTENIGFFKSLAKNIWKTKNGRQKKEPRHPETSPVDTEVQLARQNRLKEKAIKVAGAVALIATISGAGFLFAKNTDDKELSVATSTPTAVSEYIAPTTTTADTLPTTSIDQGAKTTPAEIAESKVEYSPIEIMESWAADHPNSDAAEALSNLASGTPEEIERMIVHEQKLACDGFYNAETSKKWLGNITC